MAKKIDYGIPEESKFPFGASVSPKVYLKVVPERRSVLINFLTEIAKHDADCHPIFSDIERFARFVNRDIGGDEFKYSLLSFVEKTKVDLRNWRIKIANMLAPVAEISFCNEPF